MYRVRPRARVWPAGCTLAMPCDEAIVVGQVASRNFNASLRNAIPSPKIMLNLLANCQRILTRFAQKSLPSKHLERDSTSTNLDAPEWPSQIAYLNKKLAYLNAPTPLIRAHEAQHFYNRHATLRLQQETSGQLQRCAGAQRRSVWPGGAVNHQGYASAVVGKPRPGRKRLVACVLGILCKVLAEASRQSLCRAIVGGAILPRCTRLEEF